MDRDSLLQQGYEHSAKLGRPRNQAEPTQEDVLEVQILLDKSVPEGRFEVGAQSSYGCFGIAVLLDQLFESCLIDFVLLLHRRKHPEPTLQDFRRIQRRGRTIEGTLAILLDIGSNRHA